MSQSLAVVSRAEEYILLCLSSGPDEFQALEWSCCIDQEVDIARTWMVKMVRSYLKGLN
jgi:hypothetical protein